MTLDQVITDSTDIAQALEDEFPENPLLPPKGVVSLSDQSVTVRTGTAERDQCEEMLRLQTMVSQAWWQWFRHSSDPKQEQDNFEKALGKVEEALASRDGPFFLGEQFSLVDISAVLLERIDAALVFNKGVRIRGEGKEDPSASGHILPSLKESTRMWKHGSPPWKPDQHT